MEGAFLEPTLFTRGKAWYPTHENERLEFGCNNRWRMWSRKGVTEDASVGQG